MNAKYAGLGLSHWWWLVGRSGFGPMAWSLQVGLQGLQQAIFWLAHEILTSTTTTAGDEAKFTGHPI